MAALSVTDPMLPDDARQSKCACSAVLETTELLEEILLHLPLNRLLLAQRVSRSWQATIRQSVKAQQALFLKPLASGKVSSRSSRGRPGYGRNWTWKQDGGALIKPIFNTMLHDIFFFVDDYTNYSPVLHLGFIVPMKDQSLYTDRRVYSENLIRLEQLLRNGASWRKMVVMQPSCTQLEVIFRRATFGSWFEHNYDGVTVLASNGDIGVTMHDVYNQVRAKWSVHPEAMMRGSYTRSWRGIHTIRWWELRGNGYQVLQTIRGVPSASDLLDQFDTIIKASVASER